MKPQPSDSPVRYHTAEQPKVPIWAVIGIFAALAVIAVVIVHHI